MQELEIWKGEFFIVRQLPIDKSKSAPSRLSFLISRLGVIMFMWQGNVRHIVAGT